MLPPRTESNSLTPAITRLMDILIDVSSTEQGMQAPDLATASSDLQLQQANRANDICTLSLAEMRSNAFNAETLTRQYGPAIHASNADIARMDMFKDAIIHTTQGIQARIQERLAQLQRINRDAAAAAGAGLDARVAHLIPSGASTATATSNSGSSSTVSTVTGTLITPSPTIALPVQRAATNSDNTPNAGAGAGLDTRAAPPIPSPRVRVSDVGGGAVGSATTSIGSEISDRTLNPMMNPATHAQRLTRGHTHAAATTMPTATAANPNNRRLRYDSDEDTLPIDDHCIPPNRGTATTASVTPATAAAATARGGSSANRAPIPPPSTRASSRASMAVANDIPPRPASLNSKSLYKGLNRTAAKTPSSQAGRAKTSHVSHLRTPTRPAANKVNSQSTSTASTAGAATRARPTGGSLLSGTHSRNSSRDPSHD